MTDPTPHHDGAAVETGSRGPVGPDDVDLLDDAVQRLADALRRLDAPRLGRPPRRPAGEEAGSRPDRSVADLAHELTARLADLQRAAGDGPPDVRLPRLADHAVGDQVAVVGADAVAAWRARPQPPGTTAVRELAEQLRALRLRL